MTKLDLEGDGTLVDIVEVNYIDISEFRKVGFLQEVNRQFFHPLGLALEIQIDEDGTERLGGIWDYRDDPEGILFASGVIDVEKVGNVEDERLRHWEARVAFLGTGSNVQEA
jgi:hypothetical protein